MIQVFQFPSQDCLVRKVKHPEPELLALRVIKFIVFDFDGVFTDNSVYVDQNGIESVRCSRLDGFGISALKDLGLHLMVLSKERNPVVSARCSKLKVDCYQGVDEKAQFLSQHLSKLNIEPAHVAYVGNDINDVGCLQMVGFPMVVADSHPSVMPFARYITRTNGGHGAVREICDFIASVRRDF